MKRFTPIAILLAVVGLVLARRRVGAAAGAAPEAIRLPGQGADTRDAAAGRGRLLQLGDAAERLRSAEAACATPAHQHTGARRRRRPERRRARRPAAGYIVGDIANDEGGEGAVIGAVVGGARAAKKQKQAQGAAQQQQTAQQQQHQQQVQQLQSEYLKARTACLEAKGYTVK